MAAEVLTPRNVDEVFHDFEQRRKGLISALTTDVERFYAECDPEKENLCLYGNHDGTWEVALPAEEVPPELPEPALGINFARDGMQKKDWLSLVAVHSDAWLMAVSFYFAAKFDKYERERLFKLVNGLPTVYEVLSGKATKKKGGTSGGGESRKRKEPGAAGGGGGGGGENLPAVPLGEDETPKAKASTGRIFQYKENISTLQNKRVELFWPDDGLWYPAFIVQVNQRSRIADVVYPDGSKEKLELDEVIPEGHLNVLS